MVVRVDEPTIVVTQRMAEHAVTTLLAATEMTQRGKPNRITATTRPAHKNVTTRQAELFVVQRTRASVFVRTLPNTISARRKRATSSV